MSEFLRLFRLISSVLKKKQSQNNQDSISHDLNEATLPIAQSFLLIFHNNQSFPIEMTIDQIISFSIFGKFQNLSKGFKKSYVSNKVNAFLKINYEPSIYISIMNGQLYQLFIASERKMFSFLKTQLSTTNKFVIRNLNLYGHNLVRGST